MEIKKQEVHIFSENELLNLLRDAYDLALINPHITNEEYYNRFRDRCINDLLKQD